MTTVHEMWQNWQDKSGCGRKQVFVMLFGVSPVKGAPQSVTPQTPAGPGLPYARQLLLRGMGIFLVFFGSRNFILARPRHLFGEERRGLSATLETRVSRQRRSTHARCSALALGLHSCCKSVPRPPPPQYCCAVFLVSMPLDKGVL